MARQSTAECESKRLHAQARKRTVESALSSLLGTKKVQAHADAVSVARWKLKAAGAEQELFSNKGAISSLVNKLKVEKQARQ